MPVNPSTRPEHLNSAAQRANGLNDPTFSEQQGYFPYDLTHAEYLTPRFGEITPSMNLITNPGDRHMVYDNLKTVLNMINGNMLSTYNQYVDSFYVPMRCIFPNNFDKLIPKPTKGDDLPNSAYPQVPLYTMFYEYLFSSKYDMFIYDFQNNEHSGDLSFMASVVTGQETYEPYFYGFYLGRLVTLATVLSRGQLLDYMGMQFDRQESIYDSSYGNSRFQSLIDRLFSVLAENYLENPSGIFGAIYGVPGDIVSDEIKLYQYKKMFNPTTVSEFRSCIADILEAGLVPFFELSDNEEAESFFNASGIKFACTDFMNYVSFIFKDYATEDFEKLIIDIDTDDNPFSAGFVNLSTILAYQVSVAQYFTNDSVDNIFSHDLYMQNLRAVMFPTSSSAAMFTKEPVFYYNGVQTEYDYISTGSFRASLITFDHINTNFSQIGVYMRQHVFMTLMLLLRRSLRYGDYFASARPRMLAVGQLSINVADSMVSPIDVTKNLLMQRYLNAANYIGMREPNYYASIYGVVPSDLGCAPRFLAHRKIELQNQITNNTADNQGRQTTNLVGTSDNNAFDVYIDDIGIILNLVSYDVLPVYTSGIDSVFHLTDRYDYFNPMLQNMGDVPILKSELLGSPQLQTVVFGYTMRNKEYKFKISKAHGAFVNSLPGFLHKYPSYSFLYQDLNNSSLETINPDFIRDKPFYFDSIVPQMTGVSPGEYFHFVCACVNQVKSARKIQAQPPVLF